jgi:hypothetical protein
VENPRTGIVATMTYRLRVRDLKRAIIWSLRFLQIGRKFAFEKFLSNDLEYFNWFYSENPGTYVVVIMT